MEDETTWELKTLVCKGAQFEGTLKFFGIEYGLIITITELNQDNTFSCYHEAQENGSKVESQTGEGCIITNEDGSYALKWKDKESEFLGQIDLKTGILKYGTWGSIGMRRIHTFVAKRKE